MADVKYVFKIEDFVGRVKFKSKSQKDRVLKEVKTYVLEQVLSDIGEGKSPVTGRQFVKYKNTSIYPGDKKRSSPVNLELTGDMLDSLKVIKKDDSLELTVSKKEMPKADNHNKFSSESKKTPLPARKFIPNSKEDETFRPAIIKEIKNIVKEALE